jgi:hypothetical protein
MISSWGVMWKSDFRMGGHAEIWFLFSSAMQFHEFFECMEIYQWPSLILTHTGIQIFLSKYCSIKICLSRFNLTSFLVILTENQSKIIGIFKHPRNIFVNADEMRLVRIKANSEPCKQFHEICRYSMFLLHDY